MEQLKEIIESIKNQVTRNNGFTTDFINKINVLIRAAEKQIPKKAEGIQYIIFCPTCGKVLSGNRFSEYCSYCGQKIDNDNSH